MNFTPRGGTFQEPLADWIAQARETLNAIDPQMPANLWNMALSLAIKGADHDGPGGAARVWDAKGLAAWYETVRLPPEPPLPASWPVVLRSVGGQQQGRVSVNGLDFVDDSGARWIWRGASDFSLFHRFLNGEQIAPILADRLGVGATVLRVSGMVDSFAKLHPQDHPDYLEQLSAFLDL